MQPIWRFIFYIHSRKRIAMIDQNIKLAADSVVFSHTRQQLQLLLVQRKNEPFKGMWALPGGFVEDDEDLEPAARRELQEETGMQLPHMQQLYAIGTPGRDPRFRTVSVVFYAMVDATKHNVKGSDDAADAQWFDVKKLPPLAFDHKQVIEFALQHISTLNGE